VDKTIKTLLNEALIIKSYENDLNGLLILFENEGPVTFEWDIAQETIDKAKENTNTPKGAELFLKALVNKVKNLPKKIKMKLIKYGIISLVGLLSVSGISKTMETLDPEIKTEILTFVNKEKESKPEKEVVVKTPTQVSDSLVNFIKNEEGDERQKGEPVLTAYKLGDKMVTVGWGHAEKIKISQFKKGQTITRAEAEKLLKSDIKKAEDAINDVLSGWDDKGIEYNINQDMYDAMVSMAFNMGRSGFRNSHFIQLVKRGKYEKAKEEIMKTSRRSFRKYPGLKDRREEEAKLFASGLNKINHERINS
jgi:GH24 family phage-related lysozyme (muramidase)